MCVYRECAFVCKVSIASFPGHLLLRFLDAYKVTYVVKKTERETTRE